MFLGRRDHLVKIRGYRVELREIDAALLNFAEISEAATIPVKLDDEQRLAAFVVLKPGSEFDALALRMRLAAHLPEWKIPAALYSLQSLPTTLTGKVDRQRLEAEIRRSAPSPGAAADRPPSLSRSDTSSLEAKLAELAASVVGIDRVGRDDDLRALGLDSLRVIVLLSRAEQEFGKRVIVTDFLKSPTIRPAGGIAGDGWPGWRARRDRGHSSRRCARGTLFRTRAPRLDSACAISAALACRDACVRSAPGCPGPTRNHWISRRPATFARCWRSSRTAPIT
jgi:acyl carrier protein